MKRLRPSGYLFCSEATEKIGRELFGDDWTGREGSARTGLISTAEWEACQLPGSGSGHSGSGAGGVIFALDPDPLKRWPYGDPLEAEYQSERAARTRQESAIHELWTRLEAGALKAALLDGTSGKLHVIDAESWRRSGAVRMLEKGRGEIRPYQRSLISGLLLIREFTTAAPNTSPASAVPTGWTSSREAAAAAEFARFVAESRNAISRQQAKAWLKDRFPAMPDRAFVRIWEKAAPDDWKKPGRKPAKRGPFGN